MRRSTPLLAAVLVVATAVGACSQADDPTEAELTADLVEDLREVDPALSADQAECYAGLIVDKVGVDEVGDVRFSDAEPDTEIAEQVADAAIEARTACDLADAPR